MLKHEHDEIVGVGVGDIQAFAVHGKRGGESAGIHLLHQILGDVLSAQAKVRSNQGRDRESASAARAAPCERRVAVEVVGRTTWTSIARDSWRPPTPACLPAGTSAGYGARRRAGGGTRRNPDLRTSRSIQVAATLWRFPWPPALRGHVGIVLRKPPLRPDQPVRRRSQRMPSHAGRSGGKSAIAEKRTTTLPAHQAHACPTYPRSGACRYYPQPLVLTYRYRFKSKWAYENAPCIIIRAFSSNGVLKHRKRPNFLFCEQFYSHSSGSIPCGPTNSPFGT